MWHLWSACYNSSGSWGPWDMDMYQEYQDAGDGLTPWMPCSRMDWQQGSLDLLEPLDWCHFQGRFVLRDDWSFDFDSFDSCVVFESSLWVWWIVWWSYWIHAGGKCMCPLVNLCHRGSTPRMSRMILEMAACLDFSEWILMNKSNFYGHWIFGKNHACSEMTHDLITGRWRWLSAMTRCLITFTTM